MNNWYDTQSMGISLSEDVGAPELRSPSVSGMRPRAEGWLARLVKAIVG